MNKLSFKEFSKFINLKKLESDIYYNLKDVLKRQNEKNLNQINLVKYLYLRNLAHLDFRIKVVHQLNSKSFELQNNILNKSKDYYKSLFLPWKKLEIIENKKWISKYENHILNYFARPYEVINSTFNVSVEECCTQEQLNIYKYCRFLSSLPFAENVGRRVKFLIRDNSYKKRPIIGIAALGSSIIKLEDRDKWIGWDENLDIKLKRCKNIMDLYTCISIPPYNELLGGKLICYIMVSNEIRRIVEAKYRNNRDNDFTLAAIVTTTCYSKYSSQYNRLKYFNKPLYIRVGLTKGYGKSFVDKKLYNSLKILVSESTKYQTFKFDGGTNSSFRILRNGIRKINGNENILLNHSLRKGIYIAPLAKNCQEFLQGKDDKIINYDYPLEKLVNYWKDRWLNMRIKNEDIINKVREFNMNNLIISKLINN